MKPILIAAAGAAVLLPFCAYSQSTSEPQEPEFLARRTGKFAVDCAIAATVAHCTFTAGDNRDYRVEIRGQTCTPLSVTIMQPAGIHLTPSHRRRADECIIAQGRIPLLENQQVEIVARESSGRHKIRITLRK